MPIVIFRSFPLVYPIKVTDFTQLIYVLYLGILCHNSPFKKKYINIKLFYCRYRKNLYVKRWIVIGKSIIF